MSSDGERTTLDEDVHETKERMGQGKRLFQDGTIPASFITNSRIAPKGIVIATYERDGDVRTGMPQIEEMIENRRQEMQTN